MKYKYTKASLGITGKDPKDDYIEIFQETLDNQFKNTSNWWTIQEETSVGSQEYQDVDVRIAHLINAETGLKLGDDWKTILFQDVDHNIELGKLYIFDNNTWLTTNKEAIKNLTGTCTVRRCNNTLRWIDEPTGAYYIEPCCIEYLVKEPRDYFTTGSPFTTPGGFLHIEMQFNERSNKIKENQRFLFGNSEHWTCYKVVGTGINDFKNERTYVNTSAKILTLDLIANFVNNELDDVINGIADVYTNVYSLTINQAIEGAPSTGFQLDYSIVYNGDSVTRTVVWESSDETIATVNSTGAVTFVAVGVCTITATLENNPSVTDTCTVTVTNTPTVNTEVIISPDKNYILEGLNQTYTVYLYENNVQQADAFVVTCDAHSVPSTSYAFAQSDDNTFTISNILRCVTSYLTITCTSGANIKTFNVYLRGAWQYDTA